MNPRLPILSLLSLVLSAQVALPLAEDFEGEPLCTPTCGVPCALVGGWSNEPADGAEWIVHAGPTPSSLTGPAVDSLPGDASGRYVYVEASNLCSPAQPAALLSPLISPGQAAVLRFAFHQRGADMGTLSVDQQEPLRWFDGSMNGPSETLSSPAADLSQLGPGMHVAILGSSANDGVFPVVQVLDAHTVVLDTGGQATTEAPLVFDAYDPDGPWTLDLFGPRSGDLDAWQLASCVPLFATGAETRLRFVGTTGPGFLSDMALDGITVEAPAPVDAAVEAVTVAPPGCGETGTSAVVRVVNRGQAPLSSIPLSFRVDGGAAVQEVVPGPLPPCGSVDYAFSAQVELGTVGVHSVSVEVAAPGDGEPGNDGLSSSVYAPPIVSTFPYADDLEQGAAPRWRVGGASPTWAAGTPQKPVISGAASGAVAWVTGGLGVGAYAPLEDSFMEGPCYDLSLTPDPRLEFMAWWDAERGWDGALVESSIDDGASWVPVGAFGDDLRWYTDAAVASAPGGQAWSGAASTSDGSGGWVQVGHGLDGLAGEPLVRLRLRFTADATVQDDGFAFDDWTVLNDPPGIRLSVAPKPVPAAAIPAGVGPQEVLAFDVEARGAEASVASLTLGVDGVATATVGLWLDDGDGAFDPSLDLPFTDSPQPLALGRATFATPNDLLLPPYLPRRVFASLDLTPDAAGAVVQASLDPAEATASAVILSGPARGPSLGVFQPVIPPLVDDLSGGEPARTVDVGPGSFPQATSDGSPPPLGVATGIAGAVSLVDDAGRPAVPSTRLRLSGPGGAAVDYHLDLRGVDPATADLTLSFAWLHEAGEVDPDDGVFLSVDGGATWAATLFALPSGPPQWLEQELDLDAAFASAGLPYTADVVLRFQAGDEGPETLDLDDVFVGTRPLLRVLAPALLTDGGTVDLGGLPSGASSVVSLDLHNDGDLPLGLGVPALSSLTNLDCASVVSAPPSLAPGGVDALVLELCPAAEGPVSLSLRFDAGDPRLLDGAFDQDLLAQGTVQPRIAVTSDGLPLGDGDAVDLGVRTAGEALDVALEIGDEGTGPLSFVGAAPLLFASAQNLAATVRLMPPNPLGPGERAPAELELVPWSDGPFSVDLLLQTDDPGTPLLTLHLGGIAVSPGLQIVRGSIIPAGGVEDAGSLRPGTVVTWGYSLGNTGTGDVTLTGSPDAVALDNVQGPITVAVTSQPATLIPFGASVGFALDFEVTGLGSFSFDLVVESNDADHPVYVVTVQGEGVEPELQLQGPDGDLADGAVVELGPLRVGEPWTWTGAVANLGGGVLAFGADPPLSVESQLGVAAAVVVQLGATVPPGGAEPFEVELEPLALGPFSAALRLPSDDADEPETTWTLSGEGVLPRLRVERAGSPLQDGQDDLLGELPRLRPSTVAWRLANDGSGPLRLDGAPEAVAVLDAVGAQVDLSAAPPATVEPGEEAVFALEITPLEAAFSFVLVVPTDDPAAPSFTLFVRGLAVAPSLSVSRGELPLPPGAVDPIGPLPRAPLTVEWTLHNVGDAPLHWGSPPEVEVDGDALVEVLAPPPDLLPGESAPLRLAVVPGADGPLAMGLWLRSDDPLVPDYRITATADVTSPSLILSRGGRELLPGASDDLGTVRVGEEVGWTWTLINRGSAPAELLVPDPLLLRDVAGISVSAVQQPPSSVPAGATADLGIRALAVAPGPFSLELALRQADGGELLLRVQGEAVVASDPVPTVPSGCGCGQGDPAPLALILPLLLGRRRRRGGSKLAT